MTSVTGPMGTAWCADSLRAASIFHVPEKSVVLCVPAAKGNASAIVNIAFAIRGTTRLLGARIPKLHFGRHGHSALIDPGLGFPIP